MTGEEGRGAQKNIKRRFVLINIFINFRLHIVSYRVCLSRKAFLSLFYFALYTLFRLSNSNVHQTTPRKPRMAFVLARSLEYEFQAVTCNTCTPACPTIRAVFVARVS